VKDSIGKPSARHPFTYVLPGDGEMPLAETLAVLRENNFSGCVSLEWERMWHPYLPPLRNALVRLKTQPWFALASHESKAVAHAR
jgi:sugar phosphate isomerase/epimerase